MPDTDPDIDSVADRYIVTAEFYDLMAAPYWSQIGPVLPALLSTVDTLAGPVVDVGAGTGLSTVAVAEALPDAEVIAVEPAPAMRSVLMSRLAARKDLRERVTVLPEGLFTARLPQSCAGVVALGTLGHFDAEGRSQVWKLIRGILTPQAPAIIEVQQPGRVETVPARRYTQARVGRLRYEGWSEATPVDAESLVWRMSYRTYQDGEQITEQVTEHQVWPVGPDQLAEEATRAGLVQDSGTPGSGLLVFTASTEPGSSRD